ncbi:hypothetical protein LCGC14_0383530 [marine sediment metagenome]|uniref:Uncharacterized protein n=1 Tax=marine sediment metagenome TaxID=412755 RepID=A0A0F9T7M9_9ZZZZ
MTPKLPKKTPRQLAEEHWMWIEGMLLEEMRMKMKLFQEGFIHGYKHGKEEQSGVCTRQRKKR